MPDELTGKLRLEIGHVLFLDIVGYSKLLISEQSAQLQKLKEIVRATEQVRSAEAEGKLLRLPTGDGGALVFRTSPEAPVECAIEIHRALQQPPGSKEKPQVRLRMGIHSGPVNEVSDLNEQLNMAGAGINFAQRVMDCGDAGHILLSKHVADDIHDYPEWRPRLHDIGECEVKHGVRVHLFNLYGEDFGNPALPGKLQSAARLAKKRSRNRWLGAMFVAMAMIAASVLWQRAHRVSAPVPEKSIAVLPFENLSSDKENAYFADGVQDEVLSNLAKIADLKVISRTSVMQYKTEAKRNLRKIAEELGVAHVVEGSVQRAGGKVRVNAQLIDARNDAHLLAQSYDRDLADVFAIQSEIAQAIADQLQAKLSPNEKAAIERAPTTDLAAFDLYTRAKTLLLSLAFSSRYQQIVQQAIELLNQAVARDPAFFEAYYQLIFAHGYAYSVIGDHTSDRLAMVESTLQVATRLRPDAGETHLARATYLYHCLREYNGALAELEVARRSLPNDPRIFLFTGYILRRRGQQEEGIRNLERSVELDPRNPHTLRQLSGSYEFVRRYPEAAAALDRASTIVQNDASAKANRAYLDFEWKAETRPFHEAIDPILTGSPGAISDVAEVWLACALAERDPATAERALVALGDSPSWNDGPLLFSVSFGEGLLARMTKDEARAHAAFSKARLEQEKIVQAQPDYGPAFCALGLIDAALGRKEEALREGRRAIELLPVEKDSIAGSEMLAYLALIAAWSGEKDLALQKLNEAVLLPGAVTITSYGVLKLMPFWDPLRDDPRFEKIVASLAPKDTK